MADIKSLLLKTFDSEVSENAEILEKYSRDAGVFEVKPQFVVTPKDKEDIEKLVTFTSESKQDNPEISLTCRAGGTDMSGGAIGDSVIVDMQNLNKIGEIDGDMITVEPGTYYRDFEKKTFEKDMILPSYTSSKLICTVGGMVANNAAGEKSLGFGKTNKYVEELEMVLADGKNYSFGNLTREELDDKMNLQTFEGEVYKKTFELLDKNYDLVEKSRPHVSKNSSGYNIWDIWNKETFNLSQIFIGAQGTLGINTKIKFKLVPRKKEDGLLVVYLKDFQNIPEIVKIVLSHKPSSFESFDDLTLNLALKYVFDFAPILKENTLHTALEFLPEFLMLMERKVPKLTLLIEFEESSREEIDKKIADLQGDLKKFENIHMLVAKNDEEREKDWAIRRESFNLLRKKLTDRVACPFIDDTCVDPEVLPEFLPKLYEILDGEKFAYSVAGHIGNGNFHIFPLLDLSKPDEREKIFTVGEKYLIWF
jgi:FAD/FMN-containing dehydrogenase